jgi:hypothetical protein
MRGARTRVRRWALRAVVATLAVAAAVAAFLVPALTRASSLIRDRATEALSRRFNSEVTLSTLEVNAFPSPAVAGEGLVVRHGGRHDVAPLIEVPDFSATAGLAGLWTRPLRLRTVELTGLSVRIPVGGAPVKLIPDREGRSTAPRAAEPRRLVIDHLRSQAALLEIASRDPAKLPRRFDIHDLQMWSLGDGDGTPFLASLTNPTPRGDIRTEGVFGPWEADNPRATPVRGRYRFEHADLDSIKGLGGVLSSTGDYRGVLERIEVSGRTSTPDFSIDVAGHPVPLDTTFEAVVDGTNGDTWLEQVHGTLGETLIVARGSIVRAVDVKGRHIAVDVAIDNGRLEDVLSLAVDASRPPMSGRMTLKASLLIPAGDEDVVEKMRLRGTFDLAQATFASFDIQRRVNELSRRGRGHTAPDGPTVVSRLQGAFTMQDGTLRFSRLSFGVPGATVRLAGTYGLRSQAIAFSGDLLLDASLRQTTTGWKSVLAWMAQPFFRRPGGGSRLPIRISGTREKFSFGLDIKRALLPG